MDRYNADQLIKDMKSFLSGVDLHRLRIAGPAFTECFRELLSEDLSPSGTINLSTQLLEAIWEQLNVGSWREVPMEFRELYSYASLMLAAGHLQNRGKDGDDYENRAILALDKGLILGAPVGDTAVENRLAHYADILHGHRNVRPDSAFKSVGEQEIDTASMTSLVSDYPAIEEMAMPSVSEVLRRIEASCPLKISELLDGWPALRTWSVRHFLQTMGQRTVPVEVGSRYTDDEWGQKLMTVETFVRDHLGANGYLAQYGLLEQVPALKREIIIPDYCYALNDADPEINFWFGGRTVSPLHQDDRQNIFCQIFGTKLIILFSPDQNGNLYPYDSPLLHNTSQVDLENLDPSKYPKFLDAKGHRVVLGPGDALLIPKSWWHFVKSLTPSSCSLSFWFG
ncbi:bifunctional peptidase and arginyl-hydroxylase JMJD5 [Galendromus occidentalis]|uniref:JmjC domain-containing protein 5 n=1 Tax=Galendromus occidentalis TaxID=34638 RepID=A0AAJ7PA16_9ACAR|nr:bifunctional peptidase and arginyl-hydroxylase JMJD5 [Galendromus occidentalis]